MLKSLITALAILLSPLAAEARNVRVTLDFGGSIAEYYRTYTDHRNSGDVIVIDGYCISACTVALALLPPHQVCVTPYAMFGFHSAWYGSESAPQFSLEGTQFMWQIYPEYIREILREKGWNGDTEHQNLIYLPGSRTRIRPCTAKDLVND